METIICHSNQSSYQIGIKTQLFVPLAYRCYIGNMEIIGFTAPEEMSFEKDDRRQTTTDGQRTDAYLKKTKQKKNKTKNNNNNKKKKKTNSEVWTKFICLVEDDSRNISAKLLSKYLQ